MKTNTTASRPIASLASRPLPLALAAALALGLMIPCLPLQRAALAAPSPAAPPNAPAASKPPFGRFDPYPAYLDQHCHVPPIYQIYRSKSQLQQNPSLNTIQRLKEQRAKQEELRRTIRNPLLNPAPAPTGAGAREQAPATKSETTY